MHVKKFNQFITESIEKSKKLHATGFKMDAYLKNQISKIFYAFKAGLPEGTKIHHPKIFNSGYTGVNFLMNGTEYNLIYNPGKVGLEDHTMASVQLQVAGTPKRITIYNEKESGRFGDVSVKNMKHLLQIVKNFATENFSNIENHDN
jgi:hypothetical protein